MTDAYTKFLSVLLSLTINGVIRSLKAIALHNRLA
jgi:hypothetical protein